MAIIGGINFPNLPEPDEADFERRLADVKQRLAVPDHVIQGLRETSSRRQPEANIPARTAAPDGQNHTGDAGLICSRTAPTLDGELRAALVAEMKTRPAVLAFMRRILPDFLFRARYPELT